MGGHLKTFPTWKKILYAPITIWCCGKSAWEQTRSSADNEDKQRYENFCGWLSPEMDIHWDRVAEPNHPDYGSWYHSTKNLGSEWCRLDAQRGAKVMSLLILWVGFLGLMIGIGLGFLFGIVT